MRAKRSHNKRKRVLTVCLIFLLFLVWFWYFQNFTFRITETTVVSSKVTAPVTIVQISDLHGATFGKDNQKLLKSIKKQKPDIICVTGDMFTSGDTKGMDTAIRLMTDAIEIAPVYFVPGEHDQDSQYLKQLSAAGVTVLSYGMKQIDIKDNQITLYGIDNVYYTNTFNLFREFDKPSDQAFNVLLAHIPNFEAFNWFGPDLTLCGDTHGGLIQIPLLGPLYFDGKWFPELTNGDEYVTDKGLFDTYTGHVYVSGGLGNYPYPLRLNNRPEVSVIQIVPEEGRQ